MKNPATFLCPIIVFVSLSILQGACKKESDDPRDKITGSYKLAGTAHYVVQSLANGIPPEEYDLPDSGTIKIIKVDAPDSAGWLRINGVVFQSENYTLSFNATTGLSIDAQYSNNLITIPRTLPYDGGDASVEGTASIINGKLVVTYTSRYRQFNKMAIITAY